MRTLAMLLTAAAVYGQGFDVVSVKPQPYTGKGGEFIGVRVMETLFARNTFRSMTW